MATASEVAVGRWAQYSVPKSPGPSLRATGQITDISTSGTLTAGDEQVEAEPGNPAVKIRVWARLDNDKYQKTDRYVVKPASKVRIISQPEGISKAIELNAKVQQALRNKVEEHNEKHGSNPAKRATYRMLAAAMRRGIGAYKTNPGSVRPNVASAEQWGYGRVNGLLHALRTGSYKRTKFDTDLLPREHRLSTRKDIDLTPPKDVQEAAERGLRLRREHGRGGTSIGVARARDLSNGKAVSPSTIRRMVSYFARHAVDLDAPKNSEPSAPGYPGAGLIAWLLWGGNPGRRWANHMNERLAMKAEHDMNEDLYDTPAEATFRAQEIGCVGFHTHEVNGETLYMPCDRMEDYERLTGMAHTSDEDTTLVPTDKAEWTTAYINDLPDSAFLYIGPGGEKDDSDRTTPRSLRKLPVRDASGAIDLPHLRNALSRLSQADIPADEQADIRDRAQQMLEAARKETFKCAIGTWPDEPKAIFVADSPNDIELIRGEPLVGLDGITFRKNYLDRLGVTRKDVGLTFVYPQPTERTDEWLGSLIERIAAAPSVPVIALGRKAADALGAFSSYTLPHPRVVRIKGDRGEIERKAKSICKDISGAQAAAAAVEQCPIIKADSAQQIVYGVVLEPHSVDLQGDRLELDTIERAAHSYLIKSRIVGDSHSRHATAEVVESYLAPADMKLGGQHISKGTWIMAVHVKDPELWARVESGEFNGFSIGGVGERREIEAKDLPS